MKKLAFTLLCLAFTITAYSQRFQVDTLAMAGSTGQQINLVFLGDGYQKDQLDKFIDDVRWMMNAIFAKSPYTRYRNYFNCFAIRVPSEVSGAANHPDSLINNYFGSTFNYAGIWRLVVPTRSERVFRVLRDNFPSYDQVFMLVNDLRYGGSGGTVATSTINSSGPEICIHEMGHSFAGLSDEYWAGDVYARENSNMTQVTDTSKVRWKNWLGYNSTGIYPHQESPKWYRPHQNCEMRFLNSAFCPVCRERITSRILDLADPILDYSPSSSKPIIVSDSTFRVSLLEPKPNTLRTRWELNRVEIGRQTDSLRLPVSVLINGENNLVFTVLDTTSYERDLQHPTMHLHSLTWKIDYRAAGLEIHPSATRLSLSAWPNPVSGILHVGWSMQSAAGHDLVIRLYDSAGKSAMKSFTTRLSGDSGNLDIQLPADRLPAGTYFLHAELSGSRFSLPVVIR